MGFCRPGCSAFIGVGLSPFLELFFACCRVVMGRSSPSSFAATASAYVFL